MGMKGTTHIIKRIQEILVENPKQTLVYASMKTGLELGFTNQQIETALEEYRKAGF